MSENIFLWADKNKAKLVLSNKNFLIFKYYDEKELKHNFRTIAIKSNFLKPFEIDLYSINELKND